MNNKQPIGFSGTYKKEDVVFLLKEIEMDMTPLVEKEKLIQSGKVHYSEMLSKEPEPTSFHAELFEKSFENGKKRLAEDVISLAKRILDESVKNKPIVLASLVRAGVPLGVMLHRAIKLLGGKSCHYGISIIRDRGIDDKAMTLIENTHGKENIFFVDGWTGKGAIKNQLEQALNKRGGYPKVPRLVVLADPAGVSWVSARSDDWLIPFGIMGAPVSGMYSRTLWNENDFHGCVYCKHLLKFDCSSWLVDEISKIWEQSKEYFLNCAASDWDHKEHKALFKQGVHLVDSLAKEFGISSINRIKPGIAEATRAVLRRVPDCILVKDKNDDDISLLMYLAKAKNIKVIEKGNELRQYNAVTIIKKVL